MSINHSSTDLQETPWWPPQQQQSLDTEPSHQHHDSSSKQQQQFNSWPSHQQLFHPTMFPPHTHHQGFNFNLNQEDYSTGQEQEGQDEADAPADTNQEPEVEVEKEPMFEKPLTPSDVGKLNRLVIPKQHAEKYFPLGGGGGDSGDKGLLLSFEDEAGKCWRFRYSYWNSSQSYVLTKGWSRYVKEKRLDAGDIILFERHRTHGERLFIGWRRRGATVAPDANSGSGGAGGSGGGGGWSRGLYSGSPHPYPPAQPRGVTVPHQPDCLHAGTVMQSPVGNSKTLRLFGVNMECQLDGLEPSTPDGSSMWSHGQAHDYDQQQQFNYSQAYSTNRHNHMDITFPQDVNQMMRNRQG